jgi:hypothetical protein
MNRREALHTIASFDDLMKVKGDEPPLPGHTDDEAFRWCIESIEACLPAADKAGVMLALEMEARSRRRRPSPAVSTCCARHSAADAPFPPATAVN